MLPAPLRFEDYEIRLIDRDGAPWWVLVDVCVPLEIANSRDAAARLDEDEKGVAIADTLGGSQELTIVSEPGLYKLLMTSRKPVAKRFDRWVRHEVLPQIRKTGGYGNSHVPEVATQIIEGLKEALRPLAIRFDGQDKAIDEVKAEVKEVRGDVAWIKDRLKNKRSEPSKATIAEHIDALMLLGGRCQCCGEAEIIVDGKISHFANCDHFYQNSRADVDHTWIICKPCHNDLTYGRVPRDQRETEFKAYQHKRRRLPGRQIKMTFPEV